MGCTLAHLLDPKNSYGFLGPSPFLAMPSDGNQSDSAFHELWDMHVGWCSFILAGWRGWVGSTDINLVFLNWRLIGIQGNFSLYIKNFLNVQPIWREHTRAMLLLPFLLINQFVTNPPFSMSWIMMWESLWERKSVGGPEISKNDLYFFRNSQNLVNSLAIIILGGCEELSTLQMCFLSFLFWQLNKVMFNFNANKELEKP